eukprot:31275-Pelagococcus_subviridis.AAC.3
MKRRLMKANPTAIHISLPPPPLSLALDRLVYVPHEQRARPEPDVSEEQEKPVTNHGHVPEEKARLHEPGHVAPGVVVIEAVCVYEHPRAAAAQDASPPPLVVLHRELEVRQRDRYERGDDDEDDEHDEQDAVNRVHLVSPHGREDVVQLDVNRAERQEPGHAHLRDRRAVPRQQRNLARVLRGPARRLELRPAVLPRDAAEHGERKRHERPDDEYDADRPERQRRGGPGPAEEGDGQQHVPDPLVAAHLTVVIRRDVSGDAGGQRVQHDDRRQQRAAVVRVKHAHEREHEDEERHREQLRARADDRAEQRFRAGESEDVAVDVLPPRLLALLRDVLVSRVLDEVVLQDAHEYRR